MAFFSGKPPAEDREKKSPATDEDGEKERLFGGGAIIAGAFVYVLCFTFLLSFIYQAGKFMEYRVPLFLMEPRLSLLCVNAAALTIAALSAFVLQLSIGFARASTPLGRSRRLSYFFSILATLGVAVYLGILAVHMLRGGAFLIESLYVFILFIAVCIPHFKAGKSPLAHLFVTAGFIVTLLITTLYCGIGTAKIEDKLVAVIANDTYVLAAAQDNRMILSGFEPHSGRFTGKLLIKEGADQANIAFMSLPSIRK